MADPRWIKRTIHKCPVDPETLILVRLEHDKSPDEGLYLRPRRAGNYPWTRLSGITHYIPVEGTRP